MDNNTNKIEKILKNILTKENTKIHRLKSETSEVLVVSQKAENNSYSFYIPEINDLASDNPKVTLSPIENIFDFLEDKKIAMEITKEEEEETFYGRKK